MKGIPPALLKEVRGLRERIEGQNCHIATLERQLRALLATARLGPESVEASLPAPSTRPWRAAPAARIAAPDWSFWPTPEEVERPLLPTPGKRCYTLKGAPLKVIGISVCGLSREAIESIVHFIEQHQSRDRRFVPVFLTDATESNIFRRRGFVFEYLPPPDRVRLRGSKPWAEYAAERRRLLARKWGMADIITFGKVEFGRPSGPTYTEREIDSDRKVLARQKSKAEPPCKAKARQSVAMRRITHTEPSRHGAPGTQHNPQFE